MTVRLRPVTDADVPALRRFHTEPEALGTFEWTGFRDPGHFQRRLRDDGFLTNDGGWLIATTEDGSAPAGAVMFRRNRYSDSPGGFCWTVGIALLPEHRGRGIGSRAQQLLATYLFDTSAVMTAGGHRRGRQPRRAARARGGRLPARGCHARGGIPRWAVA